MTYKHFDFEISPLGFDGIEYSDRKQVMNLVYEAKRLLDFEIPRIKVRIGSPIEKNLGGQASLMNYEIVISGYHWDGPDDNDVVLGLEPEEQDLRRVVYHEMAHTLFYAKHDDNCSLMCPDLSMFPNATKEEIQVRFIEIANRFVKTNPWVIELWRALAPR